MAFKSLWLTSDGAGAVQYSAADWRRHIDRTWTTGVLNGLAVSQNGSPNMTVQVAAGDAVMPSATNEGKYLTWETAATTGVAIPSAPVTVGQSQNHLVCLFTKDPAASGGTAGRVTVPVVLSGTAATTGSQTDPSVPAFHLVLARVIVANGTAAVTNALITDLRTFATLDGDYVDDANATRLGTDAATASALARRDASGRAKFAQGIATGDAIVFPVGAAQITDGSIGTAELANDSVTLAKIAANAVGTAELVDASVTPAKFAAPVSGTLTNGNTNFSYYTKGGVTTLVGQFATGVVNLPGGSRPPVTLTIDVFYEAGGNAFLDGRITINSNGNVSATATIATYYTSFVTA